MAALIIGALVLGAAAAMACLVRHVRRANEADAVAWLNDGEDDRRARMARYE